MFWGVLNALLGSIAGMFWKKSLGLSDLPERLFFAVGMAGAIVLSSGILLFGGFSIPSELWLLAIPVADSFAVSYAGLLSQRIYKEEKISALLPFENLASIFTIVLAFFLLGNTPVATLLIAIATIVLIFAASFDFKDRHFPKNFRLILLANSINAGRSLMFGYALSHLTSMTFYSTRNLATAAVVILPILFSGQYRILLTSKKEYLPSRMFASFLGAVSALIGFTLIAKLGLVTSTLLGFLSMGSTLVLGYFFLGDRPEKRSVALAVAVSALVALGTYFRVG